MKRKWHEPLRSFWRHLKAHLKERYRHMKASTLYMYLMMYEWLLNRKCGSLKLSNGQHEVEIVLRREPHQVWFTFEDEQQLPVCMGDVDKLGVTITPTGFILYADIESTSRVIKWCAHL